MVFNTKITPKALQRKQIDQNCGLNVSPKNHHKQVYYQTKTSTSFSGLQGIKIAPKEATYKQRLPDPSLKNWGTLFRTGDNGGTPFLLLNMA